MGVKVVSLTDRTGSFMKPHFRLQIMQKHCWLVLCSIVAEDAGLSHPNRNLNFGKLLFCRLSLASAQYRNLWHCYQCSFDISWFFCVRLQDSRSSWPRRGPSYLHSKLFRSYDRVAT